MRVQSKFHHVGELELAELEQTPEVGVQALVYSWVCVIALIKATFGQHILVFNQKFLKLPFLVSI